MKILLVTHGDFAKGIKSSIDVIVGDSEGIDTICVQSDTSNEDVQTLIKSYISSIQEEKILVISDIPAGSTTSNTLPIVYHNENVMMLTGLNLGLLLEVYLSKPTTLEQVNEILANAKETLMFIK